MMSIDHNVQDQKLKQPERRNWRKGDEHGGLIDKHDTNYQKWLLLQDMIELLDKLVIISDPRWPRR